MPHPRLYVGLVAVFLAACGSEPRATRLPDASKVFPNLPLPPEAQLVSREGSEEALQIRLLSPSQADQVSGYYRDMLSSGKWRLISDVKNRDGSVTLYAEQDGPPLWVRIWPTSDGAGTMVELAGAVVAKRADTAQAKPRPREARKPTR
jgi:hypothetical protein